MTTSVCKDKMKSPGLIYTSAKHKVHDGMLEVIKKKKE